MKKLFSVLISFILIYSPLTMAQSSSSSSSQSGTAALQTGPDLGQNKKYDDQSQLKDSSEGGGFSMFAKQILALSTSLIGGSIILSCPLGGLKPSVMTFMGGSLVYIASEILGGKEQNKNHNKSMDDLKNVKDGMKERADGQFQREALVQRLNEEKQTSDFVSKRLKWLMAVTVIYAAATGLAIYEEVGGTAAATTAGTAACVAAFPPVAAGTNPGLPPCIANVPVGFSTSKAAFMTGPASVAAGLATCAVPPGCMTAHPIYMTKAYAGCVVNPAATLAAKAKGAAVVAAFNKFAGGSMYMALLTGVMFALLPVLQAKTMIAYSYPIPRAVTFGVSTALVAMILMGLKKRKGQAEDNIKKLEKLLADFDAKTKDDGGVDLGPSVPDPKNPNAFNPNDPNSTAKKYDVKALPNATALRTPKSCVSDTGSNFEVSEKACSNPVRIARPQFDFEGGVKSLNQVGMMANDFANAVASGDADRADVLAGDIAAQAAKIDAVNKDLKAKLAATQKEKGEKVTDFDADVKSQLGGLQSAFNAEAGKAGLPSLASINDKASLGADEDKIADDIKAAGAINGAGGFDPNALGGSGLDLSKVGEGATTEPVPEEKVASLSESLEGFDTAENDISNQSDVSIFKQVSNRYFLNYTKLFERRKVDPPLAETPQSSK